MGAYLFNGWISQMEIKSTLERGGCRTCAGETDFCTGLIVCGETAEAADARFQEWLLRGDQANPPVPTRIRKTVCAPMLDKLFTEKGYDAIDWAAISQRAETILRETAGNDFEQGQWVDVNTVLRPQTLAADIEAVRRSLPGDIESGLNWKEDRQFIFLISALQPPKPPSEPDYDEELDSTGVEAEARQEEFRIVSGADIERRAQEFPQLADRKTAALVLARNSVVAAWLWRRHALKNVLGMNDIRVDWWCGVLGGESRQ